jgi:Protein of unknown function (DUF3311)
MNRSKARQWVWYATLLLPFVATLWVPFYDSVEPRLGGVPFFYWYLFLWIVISATQTGVVYFVTRRSDDTSGGATE